MTCGIWDLVAGTAYTPQTHNRERCQRRCSGIFVLAEDPFLLSIRHYDWNAVRLFTGSLSVFDIGQQKQQPSWKQKMALGLESLRVTAFVTFATFLALFMDDFRLACLPTSLDGACQYVSLAIMVRGSLSSPLFSTMLGTALIRLRRPKLEEGINPPVHPELLKQNQDLSSSTKQAWILWSCIEMLLQRDAHCLLLGSVTTIQLQGIFAIETILSSLVRRGYFLRFFFWIDVVAALSMALDVPLITNKLTRNPDGSGSGAGLPTLSRGKASGLIQRLRSIMRVTRILRLMRLVQLYGRYQVHSLSSQYAACIGRPELLPFGSSILVHSVSDGSTRLLSPYRQQRNRKPPLHDHSAAYNEAEVSCFGKDYWGSQPSREIYLMQRDPLCVLKSKILFILLISISFNVRSCICQFINKIFL